MQPAPPPPPGYGPPPGHGYPPGYPPGYGYGGPPPRSSTPRTLGTLSMVFGGLVGLLSLAGLVAGRSVTGMVNHSHISKAAFDRYLEDIHGASMAMSAGMLILSALLVYIGIGQRGYRRWAARASVRWGVAALVFLGVQMVVQLTVMAPAMDRLFDAIGNSQVRGTMSVAMRVGLFGSLVFYAPFPIILIAAFRKPETIAAMDQPPDLPAAEVITR